jgi:Flp pilus assembly protein TadD
MDEARAVEEALASYLEQGARFVAAGDSRKAVRVYQLACLRDPLDHRAWVGLAVCLKHLGQLGAAERAFTAARLFGADHPGILAQRAECQIRQGKTARARASLERALAEAEATGEASTVERARGALAWLEGQGSAPADAEVAR